MKFSKFGQKFTQPTGISQLMDDLGDALKSDQPINMLGGGNPAKIDAVNELFLQTYRALGNDNDTGEANTTSINSMANYSNPQGDAAFIDALVGFFNRHYDWNLSADNIALTNGSQNAFFYLFNLFGGAFNSNDSDENSEKNQSVDKSILLPLAPEYIGYSDVHIDGQHFLSVLPHIDGVTHAIDDVNEIPVDEATVPAGSSPGPILVRGDRVSGQTPLTVGLVRDNRDTEVEVSLKLIDPRGRITAQSITVPPWVDQQLDVSILDVFSISGRGFILIFSTDAPVDSRTPGELTITLNRPVFGNILRPGTSASFVLHKIAFVERATFAGATDTIAVNRTTKRSPYTYAVFIRAASEPSVVVSIKMQDGRLGSARHNPRQRG